MTDQLLSVTSQLTDMIRRRSGILGQRVCLDPRAVLDRSDAISLAPPGAVSPNGTCRLLRARDGWVAISLPRPGDFDLIPALLGEWHDTPTWDDLAEFVAEQQAGQIVPAANELGLAACIVGERQEQNPVPELIGPGLRRPTEGRLKVIDMSTLWAGPLCGSVFAEMGADVVKIDNPARPDPTTQSQPRLDRRLNGKKRRLKIDLSEPAGWQAILKQVETADILITSARPRAFEQVGWTFNALHQRNPDLIWIAITGYGATGPDGRRIGYGDDAAAAGGLLNWAGGTDAPAFLGDALADPLTGLAAAVGTLEALLTGCSGYLDASLAGTAAGMRALMAQSPEYIDPPRRQGMV